jgi:hypothetical protein
MGQPGNSLENAVELINSLSLYGIFPFPNEHTNDIIGAQITQHFQHIGKSMGKFVWIKSVRSMNGSW